MGIKTGKGVKINIGFRVYGPGPVEIGDDTWIGPNCKMYTAGSNGIYLGANCDVAPEVSFVCGSHETGDFWRMAGRGITHDIIIGNGSWIGCRALLLSRKIGDGVVVGAGAVVVDEVESHCLVAGVPAKVIKEYE
jgi:maltose O-acetyltransferase